MSNKELMEYLSEFNPDDSVGVVAVNLADRTVYKIGNYQLMTDAGFPVLLFELGESEPLDEMLEKEDGAE